MQFYLTRLRILYLLLIPATTATGLLVRMKKEWFPEIVNLYLGDALYAVMIYFIVSFLFSQKNVIPKTVIALLFCYCIEVLQLYQAECIRSIRATLPGKLVLGSGFLWSDLLAYFIGVSFAAIVDIFCLRSRKMQG